LRDNNERRDAAVPRLYKQGGRKMKNVLVVAMAVVMVVVGACATTGVRVAPEVPADDADEVERCGGLEIPANCKCEVADGGESLLCKGDGVDLVNPGPGKITLEWGENGKVERTATFDTTEQFTPPPEVTADKTEWSAGRKALVVIGGVAAGALLGVGGYYLYDSLFPPEVHLKGAPPDGK